MSGRFDKPDSLDDQIDTLVGALRNVGLSALSIVVSDNYAAEPETFVPDFIDSLAEDVALVCVAVVNEKLRPKKDVPNDGNDLSHRPDRGTARPAEKPDGTPESGAGSGRG